MQAGHVTFKEVKHPLTQGLVAHLQSIHIHSTEYGFRQRVVLLSTSLDGITSNAHSWTWLVSKFPRISFLLAIRPSVDNNHSRNHTFFSSTTAGQISPMVYSAGLLADIYHPMPHERSKFVDVPRIHVEPTSPRAKICRIERYNNARYF